MTISNFPSSKSVSSDPWEDFSNIFRREHQPLPQAWADVFGPLRKGKVDDLVIVGQLGQSLDGRVATESGHSKYINGPAGLMHLHRLRALVDAVVIGVGTAIADDPQLTTRHVSGPNPIRVVIDPNGRLPADLAMLHDDAAPVLVITCPGRPVPNGAEALALQCSGSGNIEPVAIVQALAERGLRRLLVEGGAETLARFLNASAIDELHLMVAPIVLGSGKTGLNLTPITDLNEAMRPMVRTMRFKDGDMLCMCDMQLSDAA
ncbi:MAG: RibD family protein [Burkholderiales bacterium]|nr:RibD family protein [Burkholderiales bacterium]